MWYTIFTPILIYFFTTRSNCDTQQLTNSSDVIVINSNHAEVNYLQKVTTNTPVVSTTTTEYLEEVTEDVVFLPNAKEIERNTNNQYFDENFKSVNGLINSGKTIFNTEQPINDIIFLSGKNDENIEKPSKKGKEDDVRRSGKETTIPLDCSNLDCNNTLQSFCGGKVEHKKWKYRLFLNECYYNKVNCNFKYDVNRYVRVALERCKNVAAHHKGPPPYYNPYPYIKPLTAGELKENIKILPNRRSLSKTINGNYCSHSCPVTCPDDYQPECGVSTNGHKRVFANHCKLDYNSCSYGIVWHMRPLSDCVGGKKADMRQNRGFIGWMQRVGIVDNKGRLVLS